VPAGSYVGPRTADEEAMAKIWAEVLGLGRIGVHDNFFALGGHSLLASQVVAKVRRIFDVVLPLHALFSAPTVAGLTSAVASAREIQDASLETLVAELEQLPDEDARRIVAGDDTRPVGAADAPIAAPAAACIDELSGAFTALRLIRRGRGEVALFIVHEIDGQVIGYRHLLDQLSGAPTVYGLEAPGLDRTTPMLPTIEKMAARYVEEILKVDPVGPRIVVGSCFGGVVAYEVARQLHNVGAPGTVVAMLDSVPYGVTKAAPDEPGGGQQDRSPSKGPLQKLSLTRRQLYRRLWSVRARRYLEHGRILPPDLHQPVILHQVAIRSFRTLPYAGRVVNFVPAPCSGVELQRRELWRSLAGEFELIPVDGPLVTHRTFLRGPWIGQVAAHLRAEADRLVDGR
jgi:thioesterase domain-containing protein/acyl carrier protein